MMIRLLYASHAAQPLTPALMEGILASSRKNNMERGITGILCHSGDYFLQVLEGGRGPVNALYNVIANDSRHEPALCQTAQMFDSPLAPFPSPLDLISARLPTAYHPVTFYS